LLNVLWISGIFALSKSNLAKRMKRLKSEVAVVDDPEQAWINKYRAAISEPPPKPVFKRMIAYLVGTIIGESKRLLSGRDSTRIRTRPQPLEEIGIKSTKRKSRFRKLNRGRFAA
jgi:hypothetical protein